MTKTFAVIKVSDTLSVVIDKEATLKEGDLVFSNHQNNYFEESFYKLEGESWNAYYEFKSIARIVKIIATIGDTIEGVPRVILPDPDEIEIPCNWEGIASSAYESGYRAAQSKGVYTEEDVRKAHFHGWSQRERYGIFNSGYENKYPDNWKDLNYEEREEWLCDQLIESLKAPKQIASVELEIEKSCELFFKDCWFEKSNCECEYIIITNPEQNTITPVKVNYHE